MSTELPAEPVVLDFDPQGLIEVPLNVYILFKDHVARSVWLMMRSKSLPSPPTNQCVRVGDDIRRKNPANAQELFGIIRKERAFLSDDFLEHVDFLERLLAAVRDVRPIEYVVGKKS